MLDKLMNNQPNYTMLKIRLTDADRVRKKYPHLDRMPEGHICPGFDIELMQTLAVLKYLCGVETQWSCQGNHRDEELGHAYILLPPGQKFPTDLIEKLDEADFYLGMVKDYNLDLTETGLLREKIQSVWDTSKCSLSEIQEKNTKFLDILNSWSRNKIKEHLPNMTDPYYKELVKLYL